VVNRANIEKLTRRWWFYLLILVILFIPSYTTKALNPQDTPKLVQQVLSNPLIYQFQWLFVLSKLITIALVAAVFLSGKFVTRYRIFSTYVVILLLAIAIFQNAAITSDYGFAVLTGNLIVMTIVALFWVWELIVCKNDFTFKKTTRWNWWVVPMAFLSFWFPVNATTGVPIPDFSPMYLVNNGSVLSFCMIVPVILAIVILFYPTVNLATLRVTSFVGLLIGVLNMISWFGINPLAWWMGVLHIPLVLISLYVFIISLKSQPIQSL